MNVLEHLPERLMTELQIKTQKKLAKLQKTQIVNKPPPKPYVPPPPKEKDFLTIELKAHVPLNQI